MRLGAAVALAMLASGCIESSVGDPPVTVSVALTAEQAAAVNGAIKNVAVASPDLAGLIDTTNILLKAGAVVDSAGVDVSFGGGTYYGVVLQRSVTQPTNPYSTFHIVYFNNPSNPTRLIIASVYARGNVGPPDGVLANLATPTEVLTAYVHFYDIESSGTTHWRSTAGSLVLGNSGAGGACAGFTLQGAIGCENLEILVGANVSASVRESGTATGTPTLAISNGLVRGAKLKFQFF
jgi:hypothetical protein